MDLDEVTTKLKERLLAALPGAAAHDVMRASPVGSNFPKFEHRLPPRPGSVLILIYPDSAGRLSFPLIKRSDYLGTHSGQVSFPGGKAEAGETETETALREAWEEIGIHPDQVTVLGSLTKFFVVPSNFIVTPVVAFAARQPVFVADTVEVVRILKGDLFELLDDKSVLTKEITVAPALPAGRRQFQMMAPHFEIEGETVWGATAMILNELRMILKEIVSM